MNRRVNQPESDCAECAALWAELQRASLLLERLAEDHFPDQKAFDEWVSRQMTIALRRTK